MEGSSWFYFVFITYLLFLGPSKPIIDKNSIAPNLTTISLKWFESSPNGILLEYQVCWELTNLRRCQNESNSTLSFQILDLKPKTTYAVIVSAFTVIGEGDHDQESVTTAESSKYILS